MVSDSNREGVRERFDEPIACHAVTPVTLLFLSTMSSKRKWDQAAPESGPADGETPSKALKTEDGKTVSEAAAAAAAIAAKIAAQFSATAGAAPGSIQIGQRDPHDAEFTHDIDINDIRNRYLLTRSSTQSEVRVPLRPATTGSFLPQIQDDTGASISTKGVWYPDRSKATERDPPLYLHLSASSKGHLQHAIDRINDLIAMDLGPLVEDKKDRMREKVCSLVARSPHVLTRTQRKWPEEKLPVGIDTIRNFNVRAKVVGPGVRPSGAHVVPILMSCRACSSSTYSKRRARACRSRVLARASSTKRRARNPRSPCTYT